MKNSIFALIAVFVLTNLHSIGQIYDSPLSQNTSESTDEGEAHIAINPNDSSKMVVGYMELGNSLNFRIYHSEDAGNSWEPSTFNTGASITTDFPGYSVAGGGDIVFAYDNENGLYASWIYLLINPSLPEPQDSLFFVGYWGKSNDNGASFELEPGTDHFFGRGKISANLDIHDFEDGVCDRQWMAVDLSEGPRQNDLYVGFINYPHNLNDTGLKVKVKQAEATSFSNANTAYAGNGQLTNLLVDQSGNIHYAFADLISNEIMAVVSSNGAQSFNSPSVIAVAETVFPLGPSYNINERENAAPSLAIDEMENLHLVWGDFPDDEQIASYYSKSEDGGSTWSEPIELSVLFGSKVFMPVVSANKNKVTIGGNLLDANNNSTYTIVTSSNSGIEFNSPVSISSDITEFGSISQSRFIGDYSSSARNYCQIYSLWTDCRDNGCKQYIAKYDECEPLGLELTPLSSPITLQTLYPNPATTMLNLSFVSQESLLVNIEIYDALGRFVKSEEKRFMAGQNHQNMDVSTLEKGSYLLKVELEDKSFITRRFVKE